MFGGGYGGFAGYGPYAPYGTYGGYGQSFGNPSTFYPAYGASYRAPYASAPRQQLARRKGAPVYAPPPAYAPFPAYAPPPQYAPVPYTAPVTAYRPPVTSYSPATSFSTLPPVTSYAPATSFSTFPTAPAIPAFGSLATYGSYASPVTFGARSYGAYTPYSPYSGNLFGSFPYSAYGGLERPLELPTLALPAPPISLFTGATTLPSVGFTSAVPLASAVTEFIDVPAESAPADAPLQEVTEVFEQVVQEQVIPQQEVIVAEAVAPQQKEPWAPGTGDEDFDLEYSRQVAARRVIGEEE